MSLLIYGHARQTLITRVTSQITQGGSQDFGQFDTTKYSRFSGYLVANSVGNTGLTFRYRQAVQSGGPWQVNSTYLVSSGPTAFSGSVIDALNYGKFTYFDIIAADSTTTYSLLVLGEPLR